MNNAPKLKFKSFTTPWFRTQLGDITSFKSGNTPSKNNSNFWRGEYPWISASSMYGHSFGSSEHTLTKEGLKAAKVAEKGTLLLLVRGSMLFNKVPVGIASRKVAFNQDVKAINTHEVTSSRFLLLWFLAQENRLLNMVTGTGIGAGKLDTDELKGLSFVYPKDRKEQQRIVDFLTTIDIKTSQLTEKHRLLKEYKKGVMQQVFSQQIRFKDDGKAYPDWKTEALGKYLEPYKELVPANTDLPILTSSRTGLYLQERSVINEGEYGVLPLGYFTYRHMSDDLIFKFNVNRDYERGAVSKEYPVFKTVEMDTYFLETKLNEGHEFKRFAIQQKQGGTRTRLYFKNLKELKLSLPCLAEQQKIAQFLQSIDSKIDLVAEQIEQTKQFKKGLLQQMFV
ncbi:restriction endonuclease subunit S [Vibrio hepatarius]|uniref:restriction endonuclease subunit S n=1 Tax=Vibrio hepatarius TaxID=171383 RepID=UPI003734CE12